MSLTFHNKPYACDMSLTFHNKPHACEMSRTFHNKSYACEHLLHFIPKITFLKCFCISNNIYLPFEMS